MMENLMFVFLLFFVKSLVLSGPTIGELPRLEQKQMFLNVFNLAFVA